MKKRTRAPVDTKNKLLSAAAKLFAEFGYHGVTIEQISKKSGISVSMVSHHFGGKEKLYQAIINNFGNDRLDQLDRFLSEPSSFAEFKARLEIIINELILFHLESPKITTILLHDVAAKKYRGKKLHLHLFAFTLKLASYFESAQKKGFIRKNVDPLSVTSILYFTFIGLIQFDAEIESALGSSINNDAFRKESIRKALDIVLNGVAEV